MRRLLVIASLSLLVGGMSIAQCELSISGRVVDQGTGIPLPWANVFLSEKAAGAIADSTGYFVLDGICPGSYHLRISHIGCKTQEIFLSIHQDTVLRVALIHHLELLDEIVVHGDPAERTTMPSNTIAREVISRESMESLSDLITTVPGVRSLRNGAGISKPVIHGLYGNRIAILNNGIPQAGQQWGNDHAPEIDPFIADHISVVKGAAALEYGTEAMGGAVLVETLPVTDDPHLHGEVNYTFQSNGRGHGLNARIEKGGGWAAWRATGTLKARGDTRAPDYFLTNTGVREGNLAWQAEKKIGHAWHASAYYSLFTTELGILRGSHIGNLTDLEEALQRVEPFFTQDAFSYKIEAPRQEVTHHLLKIAARHDIGDNRFLSLTYGGQLNRRKEFDVRRSGRSDVPALSLDQYTHLWLASYSANLKNGGLVKAGLQWEIEDNTNDPETGILPLIPDYRQFDTGVFALVKKDFGAMQGEVGLRYAYRYMNVVRITRSNPPAIERTTLQFHNVATSAGLRRTLSHHWKSSINAGLVSRPPAVNELYSNGLHQGVSGIEEGMPELEPEQSIKLTWTNEIEVSRTLFIQVLGYYQWISNYIYLQPQSQPRLTIRGAFPVFLYAQQDARIRGVDALVKYEPGPRLKFVYRYALVRGTGESQLPLIYMPPDQISFSASVTLPDPGRLHDAHLTVTGEYNFEQSRILAGQDFRAPPRGYFLLGARAGVSIPLSEAHMDLSFVIDNALNSTYRNYLNRLRYFADDLGMNVRIQAHYHF